MKREMITSGLAACLSLLTVQCDKFTEVEFRTENNFVLNSSSQQIKVETKEETSLNTITINGETGILSSPNKLETDTIIDYGGYSVRYGKDPAKDSQGYIPDISFLPVEVTGKWFTLTKPDPSSREMYLSFDENNENKERSLVIDIGMHLSHGKITITQKNSD